MTVGISVYGWCVYGGGKWFPGNAWDRVIAPKPRLNILMFLAGGEDNITFVWHAICGVKLIGCMKIWLKRSARRVLVL